MPDHTHKHRGRLAVLGAGGHATVVVRAAQLAGWQEIVVLDDDPGKQGDNIFGAPILGPLATAAELRHTKAVIAIGDNRRRLALAESLTLDWATIVHPAAIVDETAAVGAGAQVMAGAVVQPHATVGPHAIVNTNAIVEHGGRVDTGAHVSCGACLAGNAHLGRGSLLGVNASVLPGLSAGNATIIGAGSVVTRNVPDETTAVGAPARALGNTDG